MDVRLLRGGVVNAV